MELCEINILFKNFSNKFYCIVYVQSNYLNTDMCKSKSAQSHEIRAQCVDSSKLAANLEPSHVLGTLP